jgi:hypothetical protein
MGDDRDRFASAVTVKERPWKKEGMVLKGKAQGLCDEWG